MLIGLRLLRQSVWKTWNTHHKISQLTWSSLRWFSSPDKPTNGDNDAAEAYPMQLKYQSEILLAFKVYIDESCLYNTINHTNKPFSPQFLLFVHLF